MEQSDFRKLTLNYPDIVDLRRRRRAEDHPLYGPYCVD